MKLLTILILSFFSQITLLAQDRFTSQLQTATLSQSYTFNSIISDTNSVQSENYKDSKINFGNIIGQLLASGFGGLTGFFIGLISGGYYSYSPAKNARLFASIGYGIGVGLGVYLVADRDKYDPSIFLLTTVSVLGSYMGYRIWDNDHTAVTTLFIVPPLVTIISLNIFMQKKTNITVGFDVQQLPQPNTYSYGIKFQYAF